LVFLEQQGNEDCQKDVLGRKIADDLRDPKGERQTFAAA
jgi:hypothetical protein